MFPVITITIDDEERKLFLPDEYTNGKGGKDEWKWLRKYKETWYRLKKIHSMSVRIST